MLLWNKSDNLRNGSQGRFVGTRGNDVVVDFGGEGQVVVKRETWTKTSRTGDAVGSRTQIPLCLMWGITCHKSQGLTLPSAVIHCTKEFVPGLLYVSMTRVKSANHLKVIDFNQRQLLPPVAECINVSENHEEISECGLECCRKKVLSDEDLRIGDGFELPNDEEQGYDSMEIAATTDNLVKSYFERADPPDDMVVDLQTVHMILTEEIRSAFHLHPPPTFCIDSLLEKLIVEGPNCDFSIEKNNVINDINSNQDKEILGRILWSRGCQIVLEDTLNNPDEVKISSTEWTSDTEDLYMLITRSQVYMRDLELFFNTKPLNIHQSAVGAQLMIEVYKEVVKSIADIVQQTAIREPIHFDVRGMPGEGLAKIRHIGAWAVRKVLTSHQKYVRVNMTSTNQATRTSAIRRLEISSLLEEYMIANYEKLSSATQYPQTLMMTEDHQFCNRGLSHIEDCACEFL